MTGSVHAAIGAVAGRITRRPIIAFALGVFSHFLGDIVPHHDMGATETPLVFATVARVGQQHGWKSPEFWGAIGAVCPDFEHVPAELRGDKRRFGPMKNKFFPTHNGTVKHANWPYNEMLGILMQVTLFLLGLHFSRTLGAPHNKA